MGVFKKMAKSYKNKNLVIRIFIGLVIGILLGFIAQNTENTTIKAIASTSGILGDLFTKSLKAVAPILVFVLILNSIISKHFGNARGLKRVITLYLLGTFLASCVGVCFSFLFPITLSLDLPPVVRTAPAGLNEILKDLLFKMVDNPLNAICSGNYIGILTWAIAFGLGLRYCTNETKKIITDCSEAITKIVQAIIQLAPFGIFGLVTTSVYSTGFDALMGYIKLVGVLVGAMCFVAFIVNPLLVFIFLRKNPYPLIFLCLKESGTTAFFTRSSAANIPVNLNLCKKLGLDEELYSISIPLGAAINMTGAAVVIAILALSAATTLGIKPDFGTALLLCLVSTIGACGASGVAGGSLMLIPLVCSLFSISNDIAMQVVAIGFIIGVIQDSLETAINSSTDVVFTAVASYSTNQDKEKN